MEQEERTRNRTEVIDGFDAWLVVLMEDDVCVSDRERRLAGAARAAESFSEPGQSRGEGELAALLPV